jgi:hypothetical protein
MYVSNCFGRTSTPPLDLAIANGVRAQEYLRAGDIIAARLLVHRFKLYANFAAACELAS